MRPNIAWTLLVPAGLVLVGCTSMPISATYRSESEQVVQREVTKALLAYESSLRAQDSAAIAKMFEPDGRLEHAGQNPIVGRAKIQEFLASFAQYKVLSHDMQVTSTLPDSAHASQYGTYNQHVLAPDGHEITARGWFLFQCHKQINGRWLLKSALTSSSPIPSGT